MQGLVDVYVRDVKEFNERELYSTFAILLLEMAEQLYVSPVEAAALVFRIKKYRRCIALPALEALDSVIDKYEKEGKETKLSNVPYENRRDILLALVRGLAVAGKLKETVVKSIREQKDFRALERRKQILQKELNSLTETSQAAESIPEEKRKEALGKQREISRIDATIKKINTHQTERVGVDAEGNEYWVFAGDKESVYVRSVKGKPGEEEEVWGCYSSRQQLDHLMETIYDKGVAERKLKAGLCRILPKLKLSEPDSEQKEEETKPEIPLTYKERLRNSKKRRQLKRDPQMTTIAMVTSYILSCEERYQSFFSERDLAWQLSPTKRRSWVSPASLTRLSIERTRGKVQGHSGGKEVGIRICHGSNDPLLARAGGQDTQGCDSQCGGVRVRGAGEL